MGAFCRSNIITVNGLEQEANETKMHSVNAGDEELEWSVILESNGTNINARLTQAVKSISFYAAHDRQLRNAFSRIGSSGLKLNRLKCIFGSNQITYLGQLLTSDGIKADPRKVSAILHMPALEGRVKLTSTNGRLHVQSSFTKLSRDGPIKPEAA